MTKRGSIKPSGARRKLLTALGLGLTLVGAQAPSIAEGLDLYQRNRVDRTARIVEISTQNRRLFHLPSQEAIRAEFSKRNQGDERNRWLYSYNPLTVELT